MYLEYDSHPQCPCENYNKIYCEDCGQEIDGINRTIAQEWHGFWECLFSCSECAKRCPMCGELECNCIEELELEKELSEREIKEHIDDTIELFNFNDFDNYDFEGL